MERRIVSGCSVRSIGDGSNGNQIEGFAARFHTLSAPLPLARGYFRERILPGAFADSLQRSDNGDIYCCRQHDPIRVLGSVRTGTLQVWEDGSGLRFSCKLPDTQEGRDVATLVRDGLVDQMSFGFSAEDDSWDEDGTDDDGERCTIRTLRKVKLLEVSCVTSGTAAYPLTNVRPSIDNNNPSVAPLRSLDYLGLPAEVRSHVSSVKLNAEEALDATRAELDRILSGDMTRGNGKRLDGVVAKLKELRSTMSVDERRAMELSKLMKHGEPLPRLPEKAERAWRTMIKIGRVPEQFSAPQYRTNEEGGITLTSGQKQVGNAFVAPQQFDRYLLTAKLEDQLFAPQFSSQIITEKAGVIPIPTILDSENMGYLAAETSGPSEVDLTFSGAQLNAFTFRSGWVGVSYELFRDVPEEFPIGAVLEKVFALRLARVVGKYFTIGQGSGSSQPMGLLTSVVASGVSPVVAAGSAANNGGSGTGANSVGTPDVYSLWEQLDQWYRRRGVFYAAPSTIDELSSLLDKNGRPLVSLRKSLYDEDEGEVPVMLGRPICLCPSMPAIGSLATTIVFGSPEFFCTRLVRSSLGVQMYTEAANLVEYGIYAFQEFLRADSNLLANPTARPTFTYLQQHS